MKDTLTVFFCFIVLVFNVVFKHTAAFLSCKMNKIVSFRWASCPSQCLGKAWKRGRFRNRLQNYAHFLTLPNLSTTFSKLGQWIDSNAIGDVLFFYWVTTLTLLGRHSYDIGVSLQSDKGRTVSPLVTYSQSVGIVLLVRWYRTPVLLKKKNHNEGKGERLKLY